MIEIFDHGPVRELRLDRPPVNALDPALLTALREAVRDAVGAGSEAIVLSGAPGRFSGGLDVPALLRLDRGGITAAWTTFFALMRELAELPVPLVAALTGHSPAGGTVLALFADHRVLAQGAYAIGLNEVRVGLPVPEVLIRALQFVVGERQAARLATQGLLIGPDEALRLGLVDEVVPVADVVPRAVVLARQILGAPRGAMTATRALTRRPLAAAFEGFGRAQIAAIVEQWFTPEAQETLHALAARLAKRSL